jgi:predicted  nucleic acid-binding Zn-ribbon protein
MSGRKIHQVSLGVLYMFKEVLSAEKVGQLLDYEKLSEEFSNRHLRGNGVTTGGIYIPIKKIEKKDIPNFINCPKYEKAKTKIDQSMERYRSKVDRLTDQIRQMKTNIATNQARLSPIQDSINRLDSYQSAWDARDVNKRNSLAAQYNDILGQSRKLCGKHDDTIEKLTEAEEEAKERLEELTNDALQAIDEDIPVVINSIEGIASNLADSDEADDLLASIDICMIGLRVYAVVDDLIDDNSARKECKEVIAKINQTFSNLCTKDSVQNYMVDIYRHNLDLVQKNAGIAQQINGVLASVDQKQLDTLSQSINAVLAEQFNTKFDYSKVIEQVELNNIVGKINATIDSLKSNIDKAKAFQAAETPANELGKAGVNADQQAKSLRASMQTNVDALDGPLTQNHFAVQIIDEAVIDNLYQKDLRVAVTALRKHIIDTIGETNFEGVLKGGDDRFSLKKAQNAIDNAKLVRLQVTLGKIPPHIKDLTEKITGAETDIRKANETLKENIRKADELFKQTVQDLRAEFGSKYGAVCIPLIGMFFSIDIHGKVKTFEAEFRGGNQLYKNLGNELIEKNKTMSIVAMIINLILGLGSLIFFLVKGGPVVISAIVLATYIITFLMLLMTGKKLKSYLGIS